jgi:hypothetical protein
MHQGACAAPSVVVRPRYEVAAIARAHGKTLLARHAVGGEQRSVLAALVRCRTAALGGHLEQCDDCGYSRPAYNSCRNRHCPKCQALAQHRWLQQRRERILPVHHFHVVFTLPAELRAVVMRNRRRLYALLFQAASQTLLELAADSERLGAQLGITAVLHTWSRDLSFHPHLHCVVTGGGLSPDGSRWVATRPGFLLPVRVLGALFRVVSGHSLVRQLVHCPATHATAGRGPQPGIGSPSKQPSCSNGTHSVVSIAAIARSSSARPASDTTAPSQYQYGQMWNGGQKEQSEFASQAREARASAAVSSAMITCCRSSQESAAPPPSTSTTAPPRLRKTGVECSSTVWSLRPARCNTISPDVIIASCHVHLTRRAASSSAAGRRGRKPRADWSSTT